MTKTAKLAGLGRMLLDVITDVLACPPGEAYARKTVTLPDGKGGKHTISILVCRPSTADAMEKHAEKIFEVRSIVVRTDETM